MSGVDEQPKEDDDYFDWSYDVGSPIKLDCPDKVGHAEDMPYMPWGCWGCTNVETDRTRRSVVIRKCGIRHPTFYYRGVRRNNWRAANREYYTLYRTFGDADR